MDVARALYERFRQLIHEFAKFGIIGAIGVVITNSGYVVLHNHFGLGPITSTTVATLTATIVSYIGNRYWTFRNRERTGVGRETVIFFVLNGVGLLIQDAAVGINAYVLGWQHNRIAEFIALNLGIGLATVFRFWSYRKWVWLAPPAGGPLASQPVVAGTADGGAYPVSQPSAILRSNGHTAPSGNGHLRSGEPGRTRSSLHG